MAYDLISGKVSGRDFSRGGSGVVAGGTVDVGGWTESVLMKSLPWKKIAIAGGAALGVVFVIPRLLKLWENKQLRKVHQEWDHEETKQIPRQRMKSLVGVED